MDTREYDLGWLHASKSRPRTYYRPLSMYEVGWNDYQQHRRLHRIYAATIVVIITLIILLITTR